MLIQRAVVQATLKVPFGSSAVMGTEDAQDFRRDSLQHYQVIKRGIDLPSINSDLHNSQCPDKFRHPAQMCAYKDPRSHTALRTSPLTAKSSINMKQWL
jgi:hypothetical protein